MKILKNQTLYQCSYCGKRLLSKAGASIHENDYCKDENSPHKREIVLKQERCEHENYEEVWEYIAGEAVKEPAHEVCVDCGKEYI